MGMCCVQAPAAGGAAPAGMAGQAHGYIEQAEGLLGKLKGQAGGKFDNFIGMADNLLHKVCLQMPVLYASHCRSVDRYSYTRHRNAS